MKTHERIRQARLAQERTVVEIARLAGVDDAHLIRFERGDKQMSSDRVDRVLQALGLEVVPANDQATPTEVALEDAPTVT